MGPQRQIHIINFCRKLAVNTLFFLIPIHFIKIGLNGWQIGTIVSLFAFAPLVFSFPIGWINDRFSMKRIIQGVLLTLSLLFLVLACTDDFFVLAITFFLLRIANNALDVSTNSLYYKGEKEADLNKKYSALAFWLALGTAVGTLCGGFLTYFSSFSIMFYIYTFFLLNNLIFTRKLGQEEFDLVSLKEYRLNLISQKTILFSILILRWLCIG